MCQPKIDPLFREDKSGKIIFLKQVKKNYIVYSIGWPKTYLKKIIQISNQTMKYTFMLAKLSKHFLLIFPKKGSNRFL